MPQLKSNATESLDTPSTSTGAIPKLQGMKWKCKYSNMKVQSYIFNTTFIILDGSVVDPDSKLENIAHVYDQDRLNYYAILDLVDIAANKNSYFKMQLLESDKEQK